MVLKLSKKVHFLQFCDDLSKKSESIKASYIYTSEMPRYALSENGIVYYAITYFFGGIRVWSRRILLNICWVSIFFDILIANISWTVSQKTHIIFCHPREAKKRYQLMDYVYCNSLLTRLWRHNAIFLIKPFFINDQKVNTKIKLSWERKELLRWNKKQFSSLNRIKQFFLEGESPTIM